MQIYFSSQIPLKPIFKATNYHTLPKNSLYALRINIGNFFNFIFTCIYLLFKRGQNFFLNLNTETNHCLFISNEFLHLIIIPLNAIKCELYKKVFCILNMLIGQKKTNLEKYLKFLWGRKEKSERRLE